LDDYAADGQVPTATTGRDRFSVAAAAGVSGENMQIIPKAGLATLALVLVAAAPQSTPKAASPGDADAIAFAIVVDSGEMMLADLALGKNPNDAFKNYITDLREDHKEHLSAMLSEGTKGNVTPSKSGWLDTLKTKTTDMHHKLMSKPDAEFEKAFLDDMIAGHTDALQTINTKFASMTLSDGIKKEMDHLKRIVEEHLNKAKALRNG
jgi:putative membrane protein